MIRQMLHNDKGKQEIQNGVGVNLNGQKYVQASRFPPKKILKLDIKRVVQVLVLSEKA